jgi:hypothetical protein
VPIKRVPVPESRRHPPRAAVPSATIPSKHFCVHEGRGRAKSLSVCEHRRAD